MKLTENGKQEFIIYLRAKAKQFEDEEKQNHAAYTEGYFCGKAEALYQVATSLADETGELDEAGESTKELHCQHLASPLPVLQLKKQFFKFEVDQVKVIKIYLRQDFEENVRDIQKYVVMADRFYSVTTDSDGVTLLRKSEVPRL